MPTDPRKQKANAARVRRLVDLAGALRRGEHFAITRLTVLKSLCESRHDAEDFLLHLACRAQANMANGKCPSGLSREAWERHRALADEALTLLEQGKVRGGSATRTFDLLARLRQEQNDYKSIPFGVLRLLNDRNLAIIEHAVSARDNPEQAPREAYEAARLLADGYDPSYGSGLIPASASAVQWIADFWVKRLLPAEASEKTGPEKQRPRGKTSPRGR